MPLLPWKMLQAREFFLCWGYISTWYFCGRHFATFLWFSASCFKVWYCSVLWVGLCPCNMQKYFLSSSLLLFLRRFLLPCSCLDVLLDFLSAGGSSNGDSRRSQKSWKLCSDPAVGWKFWNCICRYHLMGILNSSRSSRWLSGSFVAFLCWSRLRGRYSLAPACLLVASEIISSTFAGRGGIYGETPKVTALMHLV